MSNSPVKARGVIYTDTQGTSGDIADFNYDVLADFGNATVFFTYSPTYRDEKTRNAKSIVTYIQPSQPVDPDIGDIWINTITGRLKIFRTPQRWEYWADYPSDTWEITISNDITYGANPVDSALFEIDGNGDLMPIDPVVDGTFDQAFEAAFSTEIQPLSY